MPLRTQRQKIVTIRDVKSLPSLTPNLTGKKLGELTVLHLNRSEKVKGRDRTTFWNVQCACSRTEVLTSGQLKHHRKCKRCIHVDEIIRNFTPSKTQHFTLSGLHEFRVHKVKTPKNGYQPYQPKGEYIWLCECACGETFTVGSHHLKTRRSCPQCSLKRVSALTIGKRVPLSKRKYRPNARVRALLKKCYAFHGGTKAKTKAGLTLRQIARKVKWSLSSLKDYAVEIGLAETTHSRPLRPWKPEELSLLSAKRRANLNALCAIFHRHGFTRSETELRDKLTELRHLEHKDHYSTKEIAQIIGSTDRQIDRLVSLDRLKTNPGRTRQEPTFRRAHIRAFLLTEPASYALSNVDRVFFRLLVLQNAFPEQVMTTP